MKRSTVYLTALVLVFALLCPAFCGCGNKNTESGGTKEVGGTASAAPEQTVDTSPESTPDTGEQTEDSTVPPDTDTSDTDMPDDTPDDPPAEGAKIRIVSYNVLSELFGDRLSVSGRDKVVGDFINSVLPDVVGLQEMSTNWYSSLGKLIDDKYVFINQLNGLGQTNNTGLAYNKEKVELLQSRCEIFSVGDKDIRLMNWGYFEQIESGERFIVMNTHWNTSVSTEPKNEFRLIHAGEMGARVAELAYDFECPVIVTGDYNTGCDSEEFKLYEGLAKVKDAQTNADERVNAEYATLHEVGAEPQKDSAPIDHITYTAGVRALYFENFITLPYINASDHTPILCDFIFQ